MKKRHIYSILFGIPGLIISAIVSFAVSGLAAGVLWIFVFGDNPWPAVIEKIFPFVLALIFLTVWFACIRIGFVIGKQLEQNPVLNKKHVLVSIALTLIPILFIVFYQFQVGNIGPKSEGLRCSDFCSQKGYSASSMPPQNSGKRTCSCLNNFGLEIIKVPIDSLDLLK